VRGEYQRPAARIVAAAAPTGTSQPRRLEITDRLTSNSNGGDWVACPSSPGAERGSSIRTGS
jgi:hypothetical protein